MKKDIIESYKSVRSVFMEWCRNGVENIKPPTWNDCSEEPMVGSYCLVEYDVYHLNGEIMDCSNILKKHEVIFISYFDSAPYDPYKVFGYNRGDNVIYVPKRWIYLSELIWNVSD